MRIFSELGEAIVFITKSSLKRFSVEFELQSVERMESEGIEGAAAPEWDEGEYNDAEASDGPSTDEEEEEKQDEEQEEDLDAESVEDVADVPTKEDVVEPSRKRRRVVKQKKGLTRIEARDRWFLLWYLTTTGCRRIPWNVFFKNSSKGIFL